VILEFDRAEMTSHLPYKNCSLNTPVHHASTVVRHGQKGKTAVEHGAGAERRDSNSFLSMGASVQPLDEEVKRIGTMFFQRDVSARQFRVC
jgi:hypothetical protein